MLTLIGKGSEVDEDDEEDDEEAEEVMDEDFDEKKALAERFIFVAELESLKRTVIIMPGSAAWTRLCDPFIDTRSGSIQIGKEGSTLTFTIKVRLPVDEIRSLSKKDKKGGDIILDGVPISLILDYALGQCDNAGIVTSTLKYHSPNKFRENSTATRLPLSNDWFLIAYEWETQLRTHSATEEF